MEKKKGKVKLNDELLDNVAGGSGHYTVQCPDCGEYMDPTKMPSHRYECPGGDFYKKLTQG